MASFACRVLWFLVTLAAISLFLVQVGLRIYDYYDYKSNVDVKLIYVDKLEFPSVTICNQNNYRSGFFTAHIRSMMQR